ncbi:hypothetical protein [Streptomyces sp. NPDC057582]|uniref:hypothetical protein n=1 Tax=Streptomyces sp. NPDC057582 TaxID=3346174 RepID=UPI0036856169
MTSPGCGAPAWLPGRTATADGLADPAGTAARLAGFVAALQRIDPADGPGPQWSNAFRGVPMGDERDSVASEARVRPRIAGLTGMTDTDAVTAVWEAALAAPDSSSATGVRRPATDRDDVSA